jgi:alginate O-acetyltransferase complex protein AlgI
LDFLPEIVSYSEQSPMLFTRSVFWIFFFFALAGYSLVYPRMSLRNAYLFFISLLFYYLSGGYFFFLLIFSTITDFFLGKAIFQSETRFRRKLFLSFSVLINLGLLSYFKYAYFITESINSLAGTNLGVFDFLALWANQLTGSSFNVDRIILPVGISFYTFQTISYTVDVYRGKLEPVRNIVDFGFYVSFFPQLVAGPIVRAAEFVPQLYRKYHVLWREVWHAVFLIINGLIKKLVIADYISINYVDRVFDNPLAYSGFENLMAVYGYSLQIYCDFSGYTDIAIGLALLLGFRLPINFNSPYKAHSISDFWRRWHISLSSWLRDYLYIPLGGSRKGPLRTMVNLLLTMLIGGLWHGASIRFVVWGGLHGLGLVVQKIWSNWMVRFRTKRNKGTFGRVSRIFSFLLTFHFVSFSWIFFRSGDFESAGQMIEQIFVHFSLDNIGPMIHAYSGIFGLMIAGMLLHWLPDRIKEWYRGGFIRMHLALKLILIVLAVLLIYQFRTAGIQPFIYFQF